MDKLKRCIICGNEYPNTNQYFYERKDTHKLRNNCKSCVKQKTRKIYWDNPEEAIRYQIEYRESHRDEINNRQKTYYRKNAHIIRPKENLKQRENHENRRRYYKNVLRFNIQSKIANNFRRRTNAVLRGAVKCSHALELLGCSREYLVQHLQSKFTEGMSLDNYGKGDGKWHVDHIIPPPYFDLTDPEQQRICFHYSNLRPMWGGPNIAKSSWYNGVKYYYKK